MSFKTFYNRLDINYRKSDGTSFVEPSLTDQSQSYDSDINNIMQDGYVLGCTKFNSSRRPVFGDFTNYTSDKLVDSLNYVKKAESEFNNLPSSIRSRFDNNPEKLLEFVNNPDNYDEAVKLGICNPRTVAQPVKVEVISSTTEESSSE